METELEKLRLENIMLKEKLKKKNDNKVQQVKRWRENMYVAQKERELEKRKVKEKKKTGEC